MVRKSAVSCLETNVLFSLISSVLYGCETWLLMLTEEHILRVCENRVLRRIFGPKRVEVGGGWRRLHNEEPHNLCASQNIINENK
jgi:hypothetical protein